ncbi:hypothetical protein CEQ21_23520 [Niallia circulans]|uniref:DUF2157 domain-containing protein n=1 Tax=Niallia circulans TaxID=1397 RepID=A0A553SN20_NIACI|nr:hypothetical protein [Niallia circulans]TRZ38372.1 hypothetical protein CEQ21_23520 [Niallia circulans]
MTENSFLTKLKLLKEQEYIRSQTYDEVFSGYKSYVHDTEAAAVLPQKEATHQKHILKQKEVPEKELKIKKVRSKEEMRERNISYLLYLGVFLLLLGGLFVATSNWSTMAGWMKAASIFFVSILFFGFGFIAKNVVKIEKTAFAFTVLGGLFLPIGFVSVSFFHLAGFYLSYEGQGSYLFGAIAGTVLVLVYHQLAKRMDSTFFRVSALTAFSSTVAFVVLALSLPLDVFTLIMVIFNFLIILFMARYRKAWLSGYLRLLPVYTLVHMVVTTLFISFFYESSLFQGWNFLLMSAVYFLFLLETNKKNVHFLVTVTASAGVYQLFSYEFLSDWMPLAFVAFAGVFLFLATVKKEMNLKKTWEHTSIAIGLASLIYSAVFRLEFVWSGSYIIAITLLLLGAQFVYLTKHLHTRIIPYLPAVLWGGSIWQLALKWNLVTDLHSLLVVSYSIAFLLLLVLCLFNKVPMLQVIKRSSSDVTISIMVICTYGNGMFFFGGWEVCFMLFLLGFTLLYIKRKNVEITGFTLLNLIIPIVYSVAFIALFSAIQSLQELGSFVSVALASISILALSKWYQRKDEGMGKNGFYISQFMYMAAVLLTVTATASSDMARTAVYAGGIFVFYLLYRLRRDKAVPWLITAVTCFCYFSLIDLLFSSSDWLYEKSALYGWILVLLATVLMKNKDFKLPLAAFGHTYLLLALGMDVVINYNNAMIHFVFSFIAYSVSAYMIKQKYVKILMHYGAYLSFFMIFAFEKHLAFVGGTEVSQAFLYTSILILCQRLYQKRRSEKSLLLFFIPFSLLGIVSWLVLAEFSYYEFLISLLYLTIYLLLMYLDKKHFLVAPAMLLLFCSTERLMYAQDFLQAERFFFYAILGALLILIGMCLYRRLVTFEKDRLTAVDLYSTSGFFAFVFMLFTNTDILWLKAAPGILLALSIYLQKGRVAKESSWIAKIAAMFVLLQPYYTLLDELPISIYFRMELLLLPWFILIWVCKKLKSDHLQLIIKIEWIFLLFSAVCLIIDGLKTSDIMDAIILGSLALLSVIGGFYFRYKSYFFIGIGVLLLNVLLQTRPYWGNMPWWAYLLIAGSVLIGAASFYEMQKQKGGNNVLLFIKMWKTKIAAVLAKWS